MVRFLAHPADLSHALPRPTLRDHAGHDSRREHGGGGMGNADRGVGSERRQRRPALDDARGCLTAQRNIEDVTENPYDALLRLDKPGPGIAALGAVTYPSGERFVAMNLYLYGDQAAATVARQTPLWQAWFQK